MRILHVEDAAAVACILAKYQNQIPGCESRVIKLDKYDKFGFYEFYREFVTLVTSEEQFLNSVLEEAKSVDVIHVHSRVELIPKLRKTFGKSKKIVLHYHGTDIRGIGKQKLPHRSRQSDAAIRLIFMYRRVKGIVLLKKKNTSKGSITIGFNNSLYSGFTSACICEGRVLGKYTFQIRLILTFLIRMI